MGLHDKRFAALLFAVAVVALHGTLFWIGHYPEPRPLVGDEPMYWAGAEKLAAGKTWLYESLWPPLQPVVLSAILAAGGGSMLAVEIVQTLMLVAIALLLGDLTLAISGSRVAAAAAGGLVLAYPPLAGFAHFLWPEVLHMLLLVAAMWLLVLRGRSRFWVFAAGILFGFVLTSKYLLWPFLLLALPALAFTRVLRPAGDRKALFLIGLVLVTSVVFSSGRLRIKGYPVVESATFNAWVGLHDRSRKNFVDPVVGKWFLRYLHSPSIRERDALMWREISARWRERGWLQLLASQIGRQYFRLFDKDSFLTDQLPGGTLAARGWGYRETPAAVSLALRVGSYGLYAAILVGAVMGIVVFPAGGRRWSRWLLAFLAFTMLVFLVSHVKSRFRIQLLPFLFVYCGCTVAWLSSKLGWNVAEAELWSVERGWPSWWAAAGGGALLLFLAFGGPLL